jgi:hypothetical protein
MEYYIQLISLMVPVFWVTYDTVKSGETQPPFRENVTYQYSWLKETGLAYSSNLKVYATYSFEVSTGSHQTTRRYIPIFLLEFEPDMKHIHYNSTNFISRVSNMKTYFLRRTETH